jgi:cysteinyl-tRNA synthetase
VIFDVLWWWRERSGCDVVLASNITDADDKITVLRSCMRHVLNCCPTQAHADTARPERHEVAQR